MKRILSLVLIFVMCLSLNSVFASDTKEIMPVSPDMDFSVAMGIFDEDTNPNAPITRIELAEIFYNIVLSDIAPPIDKSKYFADLDYEKAPYADFAYQSGLMNGVGNGNFNPNGELTYAQLLKVAVSFLGYGALAEAKGGYPYGYVAVANDIKITPQSVPYIDYTVTNAAVASVMRLATNVPLMKRISFGTDDEKYTLDNSSDYLSEYMHISRTRGVIDGNGFLSLNGEKLTSDEIAIDNYVFRLNESTQDLINYLGYSVDVYCKNYRSNSVNEVMYYEICETNKSVKIDADDVRGYSSSYFLYGENQKARLSHTLKMVYNGSYLASYDAEDFNPFKNTNLEGSVTLIDNNFDNSFDYAIIDAYKSYVVSNVVNNAIFNEFYPDEVIDLGKSFTDGDIEISNVLMQPVLLETIEKGDIINVSHDKGGIVKKIVVTIDTFTGIFEELNASSRIMKVGGMEFKMSKKFISNPLSDYSDISLGSEIILFFNKDGKISDVKSVSEKTNIAYLVQTYKGTGFDNECRINVFTADGNFKELVLAEKLKLGDSSSNVKSADAIDALPIDAKGSVRQPILYILNEEGKVNWIDFSTGTTPRDGLYMIEGFTGKSQSLYYRAGQYNFESKLLLSSSTIIFNVAKDSEPTNYDNYYIESPSYYGGDGNKTIDFTAYGLTKEASPCASIIVDKDGIKAVSNDSNLLIIDEITTSIKNDEEVYKIKGFTYSNGVSTFYATKEALDSVFGSNLPKRGDIIQTRSFGGIIKYVKDIFDWDTKTFKSGINPSSSSFDSNCRCIYGDVVYNDGSYIKVKVEGKDDVLAFPLSNVKIVEIDYSHREEGIMSASKSDIIYDTENYGTHSSKVVVRTRNGDIRTIVVYNGLGGAK